MKNKKQKLREKKLKWINQTRINHFVIDWEVKQASVSVVMGTTTDRRQLEQPLENKSSHMFFEIRYK